MAVIYEDASGQVQQEPITPDTLIIRGNNGGALIARRQGGRTGVDGGGILRVGVASALAQIGSSLNADDILQTTAGTAGSGTTTSSTTVVRQGRTNVLGAALEGFFGASSDLLLAEAEASLGEDETEPVLVVEDAENLQVFVNGFLTVRR
ncbi:hypothetical protein [Leptolyngbya sp. PCC 6406]|uniref:hypothetical protein n=1 Tax=Leptolyngbya sp. PCC 6406 TaxID=1173264 RepID=UPI0012DEFEA0|nr:hypothetical protein [Leptolyngbya sp. PCC 6406]